MKTMLFGFFIVLAVFAFVVAAPMAMADTITIAGDEFGPYNTDPKSSMPGYGVEIAKRVFEAAGHTVNYNLMPWNRAVKKVRQGEYNAVISAYRSCAPDFVFPDEEFGNSRITFFTRKGKQWKFKGVDSLSSVSVCLIKDYSYGEELSNFFKEHEDRVQYVFGSEALLLNIKKVAAGRCDVTIGDQNMVLQKARNLGVADQIVRAGYLGPGENVYVAFSPENPGSKEYAEILSKGIRKLKQSGELDKILEKYGVEYWK
ncbi:MAG: transporter substrate-binding domain-containing protein [Nitrospirota bacterium]|nr:transporter substrate-binding domain-containing protein [Nitrospirota bacterium]